MEPCFIVVRCVAKQKQPFIIRFRKKEMQWVYENATAIPERKVGGGDALNMSGSFAEGPDYPGCPHCSARSFFMCGSCQKLSCWDQRTKDVTCSWCGMSSRVEGSITSISGRSG